MATTVKIPKNQFESLRFPDHCPVCGKEHPDTQAHVRVWFSAWQPLKEKMGQWQVQVPACRACRWRIAEGRWVSRLIFGGLIGLACVILLGLQSLIGQQNRWLLFVAIFAVILLVNYLQSKIYTAPFLFEAFDRDLLFSFRNDALAEDFARLNGVDRVYDALNQDRPVPPPAKETQT